jgi:hypothetical protein
MPSSTNGCMKQHFGPNVATLALGSRPRKGPARTRAKKEAGFVGKCENEHSHSQMSFHFGSWSPGGLSNLQNVITGVKTHCIEEFFISLESYWNINV